MLSNLRHLNYYLLLKNHPRISNYIRSKTHRKKNKYEEIKIEIEIKIEWHPTKQLKRRNLVQLKLQNNNNKKTKLCCFLVANRFLSP